MLLLAVSATISESSYYSGRPNESTLQTITTSYYTHTAELVLNKPFIYLPLLHLLPFFSILSPPPHLLSLSWSSPLSPSIQSMHHQPTTTRRPYHLKPTTLCVHSFIQPSSPGDPNPRVALSVHIEPTTITIHRANNISRAVVGWSILSLLLLFLLLLLLSLPRLRRPIKHVAHREFSSFSGRQNFISAAT